MGERIRYTDEPLGRLKIVPDFLPPPEGLVFEEEGVKVTIHAVLTATAPPGMWWEQAWLGSSAARIALLDIARPQLAL